MNGASRRRIRRQPDPGRFSTLEFTSFSRQAANLLRVLSRILSGHATPQNRARDLGCGGCVMDFGLDGTGGLDLLCCISKVPLGGTYTGYAWCGTGRYTSVYAVMRRCQTYFLARHVGVPHLLSFPSHTCHEGAKLEGCARCVPLPLSAEGSRLSTLDCWPAGRDGGDADGSCFCHLLSHHSLPLARTGEHCWVPPRCIQYKQSSLRNSHATEYYKPAHKSYRKLAIKSEAGRHISEATLQGCPTFLPQWAQLLNSILH